MFSFAYPWLLLLIPLPILYRMLIPMAKQTPTRGIKLPFFTQLENLTQLRGGSHKLQPHAVLLASLVWLGLVLAAAKPQWLGESLLQPEAGRDIMMAVDISGSMEQMDMQIGNKQVTRLMAVKALAGHFISGRKGDRLGLILFGSKPYLQTPLTFDVTTVSHMLNDASVGLAGEYTAIGDAIGLAIKHLYDRPAKSRALILLTDGMNTFGTAPINAAQMAKQAGIKIYTIGLSSGKMQVQTWFGTQTISTAGDLDEQTLKNVSEITGGRYFRALDANGLADIYAAINKLEPVASGKISLRPATPLYQWPLLFAILVSLLIAARWLRYEYA